MQPEPIPPRAASSFWAWESTSFPDPYADPSLLAKNVRKGLVLFPTIFLAPPSLPRRLDAVAQTSFFRRLDAVALPPLFFFLHGFFYCVRRLRGHLGIVCVCVSTIFFVSPRRVATASANVSNSSASASPFPPVRGRDRGDLPPVRVAFCKGSIIFLCVGGLQNQPLTTVLTIRSTDTLKQFPIRATLSTFFYTPVKTLYGCTRGANHPRSSCPKGAARGAARRGSGCLG